MATVFNLMKQMFPILIAIFATTMMMVMYLNKDSRQWSNLTEQEQRTRLAWLAIFGVVIFVAITLIVLINGS